MRKQILSAFVLLTLILPVASAETPVLKDITGWEIDSLAPGMIWYKYNRKYSATNQRINVLEVDIKRPEYELEIKFTNIADSLSHVAYTSEALVGVNGTYELDASFIRSNGVTYAQPSREVQAISHLRHWKYEGAFFFDSQTKSTDIQYRSNDRDGYYYSTCRNIISGAPVLISNYSPVGTTFVGNVSGLNLNALEYEDYRRHQGVRHPRTAMAIMEDGKVLLITVDGRQTISEGFSAKELTEFIAQYFNPKHALNIDGGGSTTMYIQGQNGYNNNGIVNCPIDDGKPYKQRLLRSFILIKKNVNNAIDMPHSSNNLLFKHGAGGLSVSCNNEIESIALYSITGQKVLERNVGSNQYQFPAIKAGMYIAEVYTGGKRLAEKVVLK